MKIIVVYLILQTIYQVNALGSVTDYLKSVGEYFGYSQHKNLNENEFTNKIPYEVSTADEKFISEAAKLTGLALSELDSCQHRVRFIYPRFYAIYVYVFISSTDLRVFKAHTFNHMIIVAVC